MQTLNREMIEEIDRWSELGLHIEFDIDVDCGATEEDLVNLFNNLDNQDEE